MISINKRTHHTYHFTTIVLLFIFVFLVLLVSTKTARAQDAQTEAPVIIYFFRVHGCSRCEKAQIFLDNLMAENPDIQIRSFEVYLSSQNREIYLLFLKKMGVEPQGLPLIIIGNNHWVGFRDDMQEQIVAAVDACNQSGCVDIGKGLVDDSGNILTDAHETNIIPAQESTVNLSYSYDIPFFGLVDLSSISLLGSTILIGFIDGINPCSVWVLTVLLSLTVYTNSRKKSIFIGLLFIFVSAFIYGLFITGIFMLVSFFSFLRAVTFGISLVALAMGLINVKDYFLYKKGISLTIPDEKKPGIYKKMRDVVLNSTSLSGIFIGTILLSAGVSLVEFSCTSGFPAIWSNLLAMHHDVDVLTYASLLIVYLFIYQIDEIGIFLFVVITMRAAKMEEKHGRLLKLISGFLMLVLGTIMLINPDVLDNMLYAGIIFGLTFLFTISFHFIFQRLQKSQKY